MSKTIAINAGSSSLKWKLYQMPEEKVLASGQVERIGQDDAIFSIEKGSGEKYREILPIIDHEKAVEKVLDNLTALHIIENLEEITGVGHRIVAGGELFQHSVEVDDHVIDQIESIVEFAPLHNGANAMGIRAFKHILPQATSVAVFDTAFHQTMPEVNYLYSIPFDYYEKYGARRYGAHGTSHRYVSYRAAEILNKPLEELKIVSAHLGNGSSITAIKEGKSFDTSMGFTPLAGLTMGTRCGDIDASLVGYIMNKEGIKDINEMVHILNYESGLQGLSGISNDMRDIEEAAASGNHRAQIALDIYEDRVVKYIGQYATTMGGLDVLIFTAGIGENATVMRENIVNKLKLFGAEINKDANNVRGKETIISTKDSKVAVLLIPTDEELMIARDVQSFIDQK
ncbi:acetate/propionate family kinase [Allofustis seminis]|uniref:acetate/propionate family kinase n=1 Tax=Allofustis seminis TaxID=166939 RepID=UPI00037C3DEC|nr:acetate kinase [Allofustis seminis]